MSKKVKRITISGKEYTLNGIWRLCRKMWADIKDKPETIGAKRAWLQKHGFEPKDIMAYCFFCEWATQIVSPNMDLCSACPGRAVAPRFECTCNSYHYRDKPKKFEAKLKALDLKRKSK